MGDREFYGRHENNSPKDGELNGGTKISSPRDGWHKITRQRDGRMES